MKRYFWAIDGKFYDTEDEFLKDWNKCVKIDEEALEEQTSESKSESENEEKERQERLRL